VLPSHAYPSSALVLSDESQRMKAEVHVERYRTPAIHGCWTRLSSACDCNHCEEGVTEVALARFPKGLFSVPEPRCVRTSLGGFAQADESRA